MTTQLANLSSLIAFVLFGCSTSCVEIKQRVSKVEDVQIVGVLTRETLGDGSPIWSVRATQETTATIRDTLLRGTSEVQRIYLVSAPSKLANEFHGEYAPFNSPVLQVGATLALGGKLQVGRVVTAGLRESNLRTILCVTSLSSSQHTAKR